MPENLNDRIVQSLTDALEMMAFVTAEPATVNAQPPESAVRISLAFSGPVSGVVELIAPDALGSLMISNILTSANDVSSLSAHDALKELLNIACGSMFRSIEATETSFDISLPQIAGFDVPKQWKPFIEAPGTALLDAEGSTVAIRVKTN